MPHSLLFMFVGPATLAAISGDTTPPTMAPVSVSPSVISTTGLQAPTVIVNYQDSE